MTCSFLEGTTIGISLQVLWMFLSKDSSVPWTKTLKQAQHFGTMCFVFHRLFIEQHASKRLNKTSEKNNIVDLLYLEIRLMGDALIAGMLSILFEFLTIFVTCYTPED